MLRDVPWRFANKVMALALTDDKPVRWLYAYTYPTDCLMARFVLPQIGLVTDRTAYYRLDDVIETRVHPVPYETGMGDDGRRVILTNQAQAHLSYTAMVTDATVFDAAFVESLAWYLAAQIAIPIVGADTGRDLRADCLQMYQSILESARSASANEAWNSYAAKESPTITVRR
jgi:hypothetical protein